MSIHQDVKIPGRPDAVYGILTTSAKFSEMTGGSGAEIDAKEGGAFSMFGGDIRGRNVELVPGKRVVQAWRSNAWPEGVYSIISFVLQQDGQGTNLAFSQSGYPDGAKEMLEGGGRKCIGSRCRRCSPPRPNRPGRLFPD
ncbi:SRPBCC domain-containing protein [Devosia rhodophyticola]|uniref:SRPBCC domain-containing protein n=1 Tax=Devosia rhodophyticola TaxID=3026423 RepID=A0ABY7YVL3_9HYPH|nr:SRPBCC domain-containing protein [Devosia rhodophyticola]WDR05403.1 SRPBCC domain-containing protein [Devosia rhodophyticola]